MTRLSPLLLLSLAVFISAKPDVPHLSGLFPPRSGGRQSVLPNYSTINDDVGYRPQTPRPFAADEISKLIGNCSCPAMKMACEAIVVYRNNPKIIEVPGERRVVYLNKERLQEVPLREPLSLDKDYLDVQRLPPRIIPQNVEIIREVLREEIEYYDVIVDRIEIQYNDVQQKVILEVEEPDIVETTVDEPIRVQLREEVLNIIDQPEKVWLTEEIPQQVNETMRVRQTFYDIRPVVNERTETVPCDNYRIVKIPRDDCAQPRHVNGYLPPP